MEKFRRFVVTHIWWFVMLSALALLATHSFGIQGVVVDNTSLILLVIILASPFIAAVRKIKIGDFEAEIQPEEVKRVAKLAEEALPTNVEENILPLPTSDTATAILDLMETDTELALAKLRIELEGRLRRIEQRTSSSGKNRSRPKALSQIVRELGVREVFEPAFWFITPCHHWHQQSCYTRRRHTGR